MRSAICALILLIPIPCTSSAQDLGSSKETICFSVLDKQMRPVTGLEEKEFRLMIGGKEVAFADFQSGRNQESTSVPLVVWILIDAGQATPSGVIRAQADSIGRLLSLLPPLSTVGILTYGDECKILAPLGNSSGALTDAFRSFGETRSLHGVSDNSVIPKKGLAGALEYAIDEITSFTKSQSGLRDAKRAIMVLAAANTGVGFTNQKARVYSKAIGAAVSVYPVSFKIAPETSIKPASSATMGGGGIGTGSGGTPTIVPQPGEPTPPSPQSVSKTDFSGQYAEYFEIAKKTAGIASFFGSSSAVPDVFAPPEISSSATALAINMGLMFQDLNGKYSFTTAANYHGDLKIQLRQKRPNVTVVLLSNKK